MQTVLITGGTGLVGKALSSMLVTRGYSVIIVTRSPEKYSNTASIKYAAWDVEKAQVDINALLAADFIIHLAGAGVVDHKWTAAYKKKIIDSRTKSIELLINRLKDQSHNVEALISASAIGWYGPDKIPGHSFIESEPADKSFLGETCRLWEESADGAQALGIRVCKLRTGIVLSNEGGALQEFKKPLNFGIAAILGTGKQVISWIHIEDLCRLYIHAIENPGMRSSYNAVAPEPVTNQQLTLALAEKMKGKFFVPLNVPRIALKLMMGARSIEVLKSATVSAVKTQSSGFTFVYPSLQAALKELVQKPET